MIAGRLGPDDLSAAAFSLMFAFVTGSSISSCLCMTITRFQVGVSHLEEQQRWIRWARKHSQVVADQLIYL